jgi:hypothetical protein
LTASLGLMAPVIAIGLPSVAPALADEAAIPATSDVVVLKDQTVVAGTILVQEAGQYVILRTPDGSVRTIFWGDVDRVIARAPDPVTPPPPTTREPTVPSGAPSGGSGAESSPGEAMDADSHGGSIRKIPSFGFAISARGSYDILLAGTVAHQPIGSVFSGGPGTQIDVGLIVSRGWTLFAGWDHVFYGAGGQNPYVIQNLATVSARAEYFLAGVRYGCSDPTSLIGFWASADLGWEILHSDASDNFGGTAGVDINNFAARLGLGACIRPTSGFVIAPSVMSSLLVPVAQSSSVTVNGVTRDTSGDVDASIAVGLVPGLGLQGEF